MSSFLDKCKKCGSMKAKGAICPNCHYCEADEAAGGGEVRQALQEEYRRRYGVHTRNYTIFMTLILLTGMCGALSGYLWWRVIYTGNVGALLLVGLLSVVSAIGVGLLFFAKALFPHSLHCPSCEVRLDEISLNDGCCPGCSARLE